MGVMTGVQLYNMLLAQLGNRTSSDIPASDAVHWFNWTIDHLSSPRVYRHRELEDTTTQALVAGTRLYPIAAATGVGTIAVDSVVIYDPANTTRRLRLQLVRGRDAHELSQVFQNSEPYLYALWGSTHLEVLPAPDTAHDGWTLSIRRIKKPTLLQASDLTGGSATTPFDGAWDEAVLQGALFRGWRYLREWERGEQAKVEFGQLVNEIASRQAVEAEDYDYGPPIYVQDTM